ncbi:MAG: zf-HC2 domain-containing protein [Thermoanaerobaculia bacterium]
MDHADAIATYATDRYLLGELTAAEADSFEEHYFDCVECADELRVGMQFMSGGRKLAREATEPAATPAPVVSIAERRPWRTAWIPAAAAAALVLAIATPLLMKQQRAASAPTFEIASQHSFLLADSRGASDVPSLNGNAPIVLWADVPSEPTYSRYEARLQRPEGPVLTLPFTPDPNGEPTPLTVRGLSAGPHELAIIGMDPAGQHAEISRHRFMVRR